MESLGAILEEELTEAVQVKNEKALHRTVTLLVNNLAREDRNAREHSEFREAILRIDTRIEEGFKRMDERFEAMQQQMDRRFEAVDKRFEAVDKRFDDMNKRFSMMFTFMSLGFILLATLMSVYQFL